MTKLISALVVGALVCLGTVAAAQRGGDHEPVTSAVWSTDTVDSVGGMAIWEEEVRGEREGESERESKILTDDGHSATHFHPHSAVWRRG